MNDKEYYDKSMEYRTNETTADSSANNDLETECLIKLADKQLGFWIICLGR